MALTTAQRAQVREVLGWQTLFRQSGEGHRIDSAMTAIASDPDAEALIVGHLAALTAIDVRIVGAYDRLRASVVGSITLNAGELGALRGEGRRICKVIAALLGVEIPSCKYGGSSGGGELLQG